MTVRHATDASITVEKIVVGIYWTLEGKQYDADLIVLYLDNKFDVILGLTWLRRYDPRMSWQHRYMKKPDACSSYGHLMNVLWSFHRRVDVLKVGATVSLVVRSLARLYKTSV